MKNRYLLDTNIIIYFFNGLIDDEEIFNILKYSFNISIISKIEFLSWQRLQSDTWLKQKASDFISNATVYDLDEIVANETISIRQKYKVKIPDVIIGSTAKIYGFELVTNNIKDFKNFDTQIKTLKLKG